MDHTYTLASFFSVNLFAFLLIFTRLGAACMFLPGIGEIYVTPRVRLLFALALALLLTPVLAGKVPAQPNAPAALALLLGAEATVGVFLGLVVRVLLAALDFAGQLIALQIGIGSATAFNPAMGVQSTLISTTLGLLAIVLVFATDLHHVLLQGLVESYGVLPPGLETFDATALGQAFTMTLSRSFSVALMVAAPFVVLGTIFNVGLGLLSRLQPSLQIFFVGLPLQMYFGIAVLASLLGVMMSLWLGHAADAYARLGLAPGLGAGGM